MTLTVTRQNLGQIADVVRWLVGNRDAFGLVSFQPLAQVGRTRKDQVGVTAEELWAEVARGVAGFGLEVAGAGPMHFGHPDCTRFVPLLAIERLGQRPAGRQGDGPRLLQLIRDHPDDVAVMEEFWHHGLGGIAFRDDRVLELLGRGAGLLRTAPRWLLGRVRRWMNGRLREEAGTTLGRLLLDVLRGRARLDGLTLTSHHFMSPEELRTETGRARLDACVFRLPYKGEMVPMCSMNGDGLRERLYAEISGGTPSQSVGYLAD